MGKERKEFKSTASTASGKKVTLLSNQLAEVHCSGPAATEGTGREETDAREMLS